MDLGQRLEQVEVNEGPLVLRKIGQRSDKPKHPTDIAQGDVVLLLLGISFDYLAHPVQGHEVGDEVLAQVRRLGILLVVAQTHWVPELRAADLPAHILDPKCLQLIGDPTLVQDQV